MENGRFFTQGLLKKPKPNLDIIELEIKTNKHREDSDMLLSEWIIYWLETFCASSGRLSTSTYRIYLNLCEVHIIPSLGNIPLSKISMLKLQKFFNGKKIGGRGDGKDGGLSGKTLHNMRCVLNKLFAKALLAGKIQTNPMIGVEFAPQKTTEPRVLTIEEQCAIIDAALKEPDLNALGIIITLDTGIRIGELLGLLWDCVHIDVTNPYIEVKTPACT